MTVVAAQRLSGSDAPLGTDEASRDALRIFFFSDWRIQPIEWVEAMLADAEPIDLIVYGGDDLDRFRPPLAAPGEVRAALTAFTTTAVRARARRKEATPDEVSALMRRR